MLNLLFDLELLVAVYISSETSGHDSGHLVLQLERRRRRKNGFGIEETCLYPKDAIRIRMRISCFIVDLFFIIELIVLLYISSES